MTQSNALMESDNYVFYDETTSLCEECLALVPAKIIFQNQGVYYLKNCQIHGSQKTLISTNIQYYKQSRSIGDISLKPLSYRNKLDKGCPFDCGLCEEHEQHTAMGIIEIIDECNMHCPTCIAGSHPGAGNVKSLDEIKRMLETLVKHEGNADVVMISGGEPTIHPRIIDVLRIAYEMPFKHIMLITNGVSIAKDISFVTELEEFRDKLEVYLQFDSLNPSVLKNIRGEDLREVRLNAIRNLEDKRIHSTLICVVKKSINDQEMNDVINFALQYKYIRGVTFQPCKITGRSDDFDKNQHYVTLSEVRDTILKDSLIFSNETLIPHPLNPENICIGYIKKDGENVQNVSRFLFNSDNSMVRYKLKFSNTDRLRKQMYFLPELNTIDFKYEDLFRVTIVSFLDKFNFCTSSVKRSCIHFVTAKCELIPIDTYYLFYQDSNDIPGVIHLD